MRARPPLLLLLLLLAAGGPAAAGRAQAASARERAACVAADKSASQLVAAHKLVEAREPLQICAAQECSAAQRKDCQRLSAQVDAAMPTIVLRATGADGKELHAVQVTVDGKPLADKLDGAALAVDPGDHTFKFTAEGLPPVTRTLTLAEGAKARAETIAMAAEPAPTAAPGPTPPPADAPVDTAATPAAPSGGPSPSTRGIVTGGLAFAGVTGLALGGVFGFLTISAKQHEQADCASPTSCKDHDQAKSDRSTAFSDGAASTVGFVAGGLLLAGAAVYYFVARPGRADEPASTALVVAPSVGPGAGGVSLTGAF